MTPTARWWGVAVEALPTVSYVSDCRKKRAKNTIEFAYGSELSTVTKADEEVGGGDNTVALE